MRWPPRREDTDVTNLVVSVPATGAALSVGGRRVLGFLLTVATADAGAVINLYDGTDATGQYLGALATDAAGTVRHSIGLPGIPLQTDLFVTAGVPVTGSILIGTDL